MRLKVAVRGAVQGVGFRPFVHRLATEQRLTGWVCNSPQGVFIEAEGPRLELNRFLTRLERERPPLSSIQHLEFSWLTAAGYRQFEIRKSETSGNKTAVVLPDAATCPECLREIFDPANRRHRYPFTNCTHCGPRFSIVESLPYDRANTTMRGFAMCPECAREYHDPANRRFHAQPNACPKCGPQLAIWENRSCAFGPPASVASGHLALLVAAKAIRRGQIVAVKGIGGFHLMTDARNQEAVARLRMRKHREERPFALMFPSLESAKLVCNVSAREELLLLSCQAPIVLLGRKGPADEQVAAAVAPENPNLGVMLPSNPLYHLLMEELGFPVVATSGNLSEEPICTDEWDALERLRPIADLFLVHNRPIARHVDDSIVRVVLGQEMMIRRARGYAPLPVSAAILKENGSNEAGEGTGSKGRAPAAVMAVGGHLKNSVALALGEQVFISQHIGDLETEKAYEAFRRVIADFQRLYGTKPETVAMDLHPDYFSSKFARTMGAAAFPVQHHLAHVLSCMADNGIEGPVLGVSWDGTGYGDDGTIWGGEFFVVRDTTARRVARLREFSLPGADAAIREPRRAAIGLLHEMFGADAFGMPGLKVLESFTPLEIRALGNILQRRFRSPMTSSAGRLFDAVAALVGVRQINRFEGQAAMNLEFAADCGVVEAYPFAVRDEGLVARLDWEPMVAAILSDLKQGVPTGVISARFHNALVEGIIEIAHRAGLSKVALSGGCFQNCYLLEHAVARLRSENFLPFWHHSVPANDGGISLGQIAAALKKIVLTNPKNRSIVPFQTKSPEAIATETA